MNNIKTSGAWKIQLAIVNNFISPLYNDEDHVMRSKIDNIETLINDEAEEIFYEELFYSLKTDSKII